MTRETDQLTPIAFRQRADASTPALKPHSSAPNLKGDSVVTDSGEAHSVADLLGVSANLDISPDTAEVRVELVVVPRKRPGLSDFGLVSRAALALALFQAMSRTDGVLEYVAAVAAVNNKAKVYGLKNRPKQIRISSLSSPITTYRPLRKQA